MEMRGADGGPVDIICALPAFWAGLLYDKCVRPRFCAAKNALRKLMASLSSILAQGFFLVNLLRRRAHMHPCWGKGIWHAMCRALTAYVMGSYVMSVCPAAEHSREAHVHRICSDSRCAKGVADAVHRV